MRSTKKCVSHGAWEAHFRLLRPLRSETITFFLAIYTAEGCQKWQNVILPLHEKQKKLCFSRSTRIKFLTFVTPLDWYWRFFWGHARLWVAFSRLRRQNGQFEPSQYAPGARMTVVTTNSLKLLPEVSSMQPLVRNMPGHHKTATYQNMQLILESCVCHEVV